MTFEKFVCWNSENIRRVMDVEATQAENHIFLATHHPIKMYLQELIRDTSVRVPYNEQQFLKDFLAEKDFAFVPVLGTSGTGKSHLIRWLAANIQSTPQRKVLLIPKIGTNLKDIINLILQGMEGEKFDEYRQRINRATNTLTETQARIQLLNQLAAAVGDNGKRDKSKLTDEENYLIEELDSLLYDPFFRENYWLKDNGIIHRLVIHILGYRDTLEIVEERREFSLHDLPNDVHHIQKASEKSRSFYTELWSNDDIKKITVDWLNLHLDEAITQVLNLGREDLQRLMREVRETLAEQGIELVLLIEDFAKLQGIDRELLEAVLARPQQPGSKPLCSMRTALACTTGYFKALIDTVQQRVTFSVNLDVEKIGEQSLVTQVDIQEFVSKYLNAVRLENEVILNWVISDQQTDLNAESLTNACRDCEHREACHAGFGAVNEIGLYPFNAIALKQMFAKVNQKEFNPRILIKDVLKYTLENGYDDIQKGIFPSVSLQKHFGKMRLSAMLQQDINIKDPQNFDRRQVLLDSWDDGDELCDLPTDLHTAFNLPPIGVKIKQLSQITTTVEEQKQKNVYVTEPKSVVNTSIKLEGISENLAKEIEILNNWNNQSILPQEGVAKKIREFIFPAIVQYIEWDNEMLLEKTFASSSSKYFKQRNIVFYSPRVTRENIGGVKLTLPLNPDDKNDFRETVIAFQAIVLYSHYKHWKFKDGDRYFRTYSKQLEKWSQYVLTAIRRYPRESGAAWNPLPAAVELLSISSTMAGHDTNSLDKLINALFLEIDNQENVNRASSWKKLFDTLKKHRQDLLDIVQSRIACTKGYSTQFQIIDSTQIIEPLEKIRKSWQPQSEIPSDVNCDILQPIYKSRQQVDELLEKAILEETERQLALYQSLVMELGDNFKKKDVTDKLKVAMEKAREAAVFRGRKNFDDMTLVLNQFGRTATSSYMESMKRLQSEQENCHAEIAKLLPYLSEDYQKAMTDTEEFIKHTNNFLDASLAEVKQNISDLEKSDGATIETSHQAIQDGLANLRKLLIEIKG
ncbi:MAG: protein DpdH [Dolichospermum sp.]|nr:protein DpdH [Dolichospermum sp.]